MRFPENILQSIFQQLLPTACITCQEHQALSICNRCLSTLQNECLFNYECCYQCGITLQRSEIAQQRCATCEINQPYFDETHCLDRYDGMLQTALHELKYQKRIAFAHALSNTWNLLLSKRLTDISADYFLPVPLSLQKLSQRGFNQSWEIGKKIHCRNGIPKTPYILQRHHYAERQAGHSLSHRQEAIQGVFYIEEKYIKQLHNKAVIVFDDVMTSGATLNEIARVLKDNGVSRVINWVLLRAMRPN
jgi:ComF family protein